MSFGPAERLSYLRFRNAFAEVIDPRLYSIEWLDQQLIKGVYRIWASENAAIIAGIKIYPTGATEVEGIIEAGDPQEAIEQLIPQAEAWGRSLGCIGAVIESRPAWARLLKQQGYEPHQLRIRKVF